MSDTSQTGKGSLGWAIRVVGALAAVFALYSFTSFILYVLRIQTLQDFGLVWERGLNYEEWPALRAELAMYNYYGFSLSWLDNRFVNFVYAKAYPFSQFLYLLLIRLTGLAYIFLPVLFGCATAICVGRVTYHRRLEGFLNKSSTLVHHAGKLRFFVYSFIGLYLSAPFGDYLVWIGYIPIYSEINLLGQTFYLWYSSPIFLYALVCLPLALILYLQASRFQDEI